MTQNTADRLYLLLVDRLRVIGGTRHAAEDIAAEIDALTAERDEAAKYRDQYVRECGELTAERDEAREQHKHCGLFLDSANAELRECQSALRLALAGTEQKYFAIPARIDDVRAALADAQAQLADVVFAAHMPIDYEYGLPSWINQYLYAGWIGAKISPHIMQMIEGGTLTFPDSPAEKALTAARAEVARLTPAAEAFGWWENYASNPSTTTWDIFQDAAQRARDMSFIESRAVILTDDQIDVLKRGIARAREAAKESQP